MKLARLPTMIPSTSEVGMIHTKLKPRRPKYAIHTATQVAAMAAAHVPATVAQGTNIAMKNSTNSGALT
jgi:hypothetical protein